MLLYRSHFQLLKLWHSGTCSSVPHIFSFWNFNRVVLARWWRGTMVPVSMYCKLDSFGRMLNHALDNLDDQQLLLQHLSGTRYQVPCSLVTPNAMPITYSCCQDTNNSLALIVMSGVSMHLLPPCTLPVDVWYQTPWDSIMQTFQWGTTASFIATSSMVSCTWAVSNIESCW
jgi:hypothetical protein